MWAIFAFWTLHFCVGVVADDGHVGHDCFGHVGCVCVVVVVVDAV